MKLKNILILLLALCFTFTACAHEQSKETMGTTASQQQSSETTTETETTVGTSETVGEIITLHLGAITDPNTKFPPGQSIEDNQYLDIIREQLGIEIVYDWVASVSDYNQKINMCIGSDTLPDAMNVNYTQFRSMLNYGQLMDITEVFETYASDMLKSFVDSGGQPLKDMITIDGKMMAIPAPTLAAVNVDEMWIRQDWLDELGLEAPRTLDELRNIANAFVTQDPDRNEKDDTIGILGPPNSGVLAGPGGNLWGLDPIFNVFQSFPGSWLEDENGEIIYGSVQKETKEALKELADMYSQGLIDPQLLTRADCFEPTLAGEVGIFFGPWWIGYTLAPTIMDGSMDWRAYLCPVTEDGQYYTQMGPPASQFIVISKKCEHPEAVIKIINLLISEQQKWVEEGLEAILPSSNSYPLYNVYDNADEDIYTYKVLRDYLSGKIDINEIDFSTHKLLYNDLEAIKVLKLEPYDDFSPQYWNTDHELAPTNLPRLISIMIGVGAIAETPYNEVYSVYYGSTPTMETKLFNLYKLEAETFAKIILGQAPLDSFDTFVERWHVEGGQEILDELEEIVK